MEDCASSLPETNVINFSNILLHAANHSVAENEADDFTVPVMLLEHTNSTVRLCWPVVGGPQVKTQGCLSSVKLLDFGKTKFAKLWGY